MSGLDHVLAMVAVGLWGAQLRAPAVWLLPVTFPMVMAFSGGMLGLLGVALPGAEIGIAVSAIVLGPRCSPSGGRRSRSRRRAVGAFAVFHGHAHGTELRRAPTASPTAWASSSRRGSCTPWASRSGSSTMAGGRGAPRGRRRRRRGGRVVPLGGGHVRRAPVLLAVGLVLATSRDAHAHLVNTGFGPFYDGLAHPLVVVSDLLPALAVALLGGPRGPATGRRVVITLPVAWLVGMALWRRDAPAAAPPASGAALTALLGVLVASDRPWPRAAVVAVAVVAGVALGLGNGRELGPVAGGRAALVGVACTVFVLASIVAGQVAVARAGAARVVARVAGSWVASATGLLMLGWTLR